MMKAGRAAAAAVLWTALWFGGAGAAAQPAPAGAGSATPAARPAVAAATPASLGAAAAAVAATSAAAAAPPLVFFGNRDLPPFEWLEDGVPRGANIEMVQAVGRLLGRPVEVRLLHWGESQARVRDGEGDALTSLARTDERETLYAFSRPSLPIALSMFVRADESVRLNMRDLSRTRIGVTRAGLSRQVLGRLHPEAPLVPVDNLFDGFERLLRGEIDALAAPGWAGLHVLKELKIDRVVELPPFHQVRSSIAVRRGDTALLAQLDDALLRLQRDGELDRIIDRYSPQRVVQLSGMTLHMGRIAMLVAAAALLALGVAIVLLQRQRQRLKAEIAERREAEVVARASADRTLRMQRLAAALSAAVTPEDVGAVIVSHAGEIAGSPRVLLAEPVRNGRRWQLLAGCEPDIAESTASRRPSTEAASLLDRAVAHDAPVVLGDRSALLAVVPDWMARMGDAAPQALHLTALRASTGALEHSRAVGVVMLAWPMPQAFDARRSEQLATMAAQVAQALERAQLRRGERRQGARQASLQAIASALTTASGVEDACAVVVSAGVRALDALHGAVALFDDPLLPGEIPAADSALSVMPTDLLPPTLSSSGSAAKQRPRPGFPLSSAAHGGEPVFLESRLALERAVPCVDDFDASMQAVAALPLEAPAVRGAALVGGATRLGALVFTFAHERDFDSDERVFLEALAGMAARAIERGQLLDRLRASLADSEAERRQLDAVVKQFPVGLLVAEAPSGRIVRSSLVVDDIAGRSVLQQDQGSTPWRVFRHGSSEPLPRAEWPLARVLASGEDVAPELLELERPDGSRRVVDVRATAVRDGQGRLCAAAAMLFDVTDRLAAQQARDAAELRLQVAVDAAGMGSWDIDVSTGQALWSPRMYDLLGLPQGLGRESLDRMVAQVSAADRPAVHAALARAIADETAFEATFRVTGGDGAERWLLGRGHTLHAAPPGATRLIGVHFDITPLMRVRQELEAADRQKDEFLDLLSHELRNPLAPIVTAAQLLTRAGDRTDVRESAVPVIQRQAKQLARLVDDLLEISRIRHNRIELQRGRVVLDAAVEIAHDTVRALLQKQRLQLHLRIPTDLALWADPARVTQMLSNLLRNAVKYAPPGGHIEMDAKIDGQMAVIQVADNGPGIPSSFLPKVFDLFTQDRGTPGRDGEGGLGLGLALVKRLAELHGGSITAFSAGIGNGASFSLRLPLAFQTDQQSDLAAELQIKPAFGTHPA